MKCILVLPAVRNIPSRGLFVHLDYLYLRTSIILVGNVTIDHLGEYQFLAGTILISYMETTGENPNRKEAHIWAQPSFRRYKARKSRGRCFDDGVMCGWAGPGKE